MQTYTRQVSMNMVLTYVSIHLARNVMYYYDLYCTENMTVIKRSTCTLEFMQSTFFYLGRFLKKLADDQCSSIIRGSIYFMKQMYIYNLLPKQWIDQKFDV